MANPRSGRKPKPHHLKLIQGNPGGRRLVEPPSPPPARPYCPEWLSPFAKTEWRRIVPPLDRLGLLTKVDRSTLAGYCEAVSNFKRATEIINATDLMVEGRKGEPTKNPMLQVQRDSLRLMSNYSAMFGLSPSDRVRLLGDPGAGSQAPSLEEVLGG